MSSNEKSWNDMSMDEPLDDAGYNPSLFEDFDFDDFDDHHEYDDHFEDTFRDAFDEFEDYPKETASYIDKLEEERKDWEFEVEAWAEQLELLDPTLDPKMWRAREGCGTNCFNFVPGTGKKLDVLSCRNYGHRSGYKPRERNRERRREREIWRERQLEQAFSA